MALAGMAFAGAAMTTSRSCAAKIVTNEATFSTAAQERQPTAISFQMAVHVFSTPVGSKATSLEADVLITPDCHLTTGD